MKRPEQQMHRNLVQHIRQRGVPGLLWWHSPNGARFGGRDHTTVLNGVKKITRLRPDDARLDAVLKEIEGVLAG